MREDIKYISAQGGNSAFTIDLAGISYCDGTYKIYRPNSAIYCFEYIVSGSGTVTCGSRTFTARGGDVYILEAGKNHYYYSSADDPWVKIWFNIRGNLIPALLDTYGINGVYHIENAGSEIRTEFERFVNLCEHSRKNPDAMTEKASVVFLMLVQKLCRANSVKSALLSDSEKIMRYINANAEKNIKISQLASLIYRSPSQTIRIFKKDFGITPYEYAMNRKIEIAGYLLRNTGMRIKEIAYRLGFADEHYFSGYFKQKIGMPPKSFRDGKNAEKTAAAKD